MMEESDRGGQHMVRVSIHEPGNASLVLLHETKMSELSVERGDIISMTSNMGESGTCFCFVEMARCSCATIDILMNQDVADNLQISSGDFVSRQKMEYYMKCYYDHAFRPAYSGNIYHIDGNYGRYKFKVIYTNPTGCCIVTPDTQLLLSVPLPLLSSKDACSDCAMMNHPTQGHSLFSHLVISHNDYYDDSVVAVSEDFSKQNNCETMQSLLLETTQGRKLATTAITSDLCKTEGVEMNARLISKLSSSVGDKLCVIPTTVYEADFLKFGIVGSLFRTEDVTFHISLLEEHFDEHVGAIINIGDIICITRKDDVLKYVLVDCKPCSYCLVNSSCRIFIDTVPAFIPVRIKQVEQDVVGYETEKQELKEKLHTFIKHRNVTMVLVTGRSGVGKTKLVEDFLRHQPLPILKPQCSQILRPADLGGIMQSASIIKPVVLWIDDIHDTEEDELEKDESLEQEEKLEEDNESLEEEDKKLEEDESLEEEEEENLEEDESLEEEEQKLEGESLEEEEEKLEENNKSLEEEEEEENVEEGEEEEEDKQRFKQMMNVLSRQSFDGLFIIITGRHGHIPEAKLLGFEELCISVPNEHQWIEILRQSTRHSLLSEDVDIPEVARELSGLTPQEMYWILEEAERDALVSASNRSSTLETVSVCQSDIKTSILKHRIRSGQNISNEARNYNCTVKPEKVVISKKRLHDVKNYLQTDSYDKFEVSQVMESFSEPCSDKKLAKCETGRVMASIDDNDTASNSIQIVNVPYSDRMQWLVGLPHFATLKDEVRKNPANLRRILDKIKRNSIPLYAIIRDNFTDFLKEIDFDNEMLWQILTSPSPLTGGVEDVGKDPGVQELEYGSGTLDDQTSSGM